MGGQKSSALPWAEHSVLRLQAQLCWLCRLQAQLCWLCRLQAQLCWLCRLQAQRGLSY